MEMFIFAITLVKTTSIIKCAANTAAIYLNGKMGKWKNYDNVNSR